MVQLAHGNSNRPATPATFGHFCPYNAAMAKGRGKGKISKDLVAASCAAVLAVYAAGYLRTRDAARRYDTQAKERRAVGRAQRTAVNASPAVSEAPASHPAGKYRATVANGSATLAAPRRPSQVAAGKPSAGHAASPMAVATSPAPGALAASTADASASAVQSSSPDAPREIAPVPLPAVDTTGPTPIAITREAAAVFAAKWRDGTYTGLGDSPHGDIEARVVIKDGRIIEAGIVTCDTRYPCSVIDPLIHQPVERQSADVDYMSRATESSDAYYNALVAALNNAAERSASEASAPK